ncbi:MAG: hypothetical protein N2039_07930 [Gemmataceae bacterium]|nr:hypothetical protein [Gemmataceae bacterium]
MLQCIKAAQPGTLVVCREVQEMPWWVIGLLFVPGLVMPGLVMPRLADPRGHACPWLDDIIDDTELPTLSENREEYYAYNHFVLWARKFKPEQLAQHTRKELTWRLLFGRDRTRYRGEIVRVEGRLKRLIWIGRNKALEAQGVKDLYEAWIFGREYFSNPTCVIVSELPPGLEPAEDIRDLMVYVDGFYFKRYKYRAVNDTRLAPLVIGRTLIIQRPTAMPVRPGESAFDRLFLPTLLTVLFGMVLLAFGLQWWFRRGDRRALSTVQKGQGAFVLPQETAPWPYSREPSPN